MAAKKGLGRGFESLIPSDLLDESFDPTAGDDKNVSDLRHIKISEIQADPGQPRSHFDQAALEELAASIDQHGVLQPIVVMAEKGKYRIVAGERRYRASTIAGKTTIPALVRSATAQHKLELALIENIQRKDLNAIETATAYGKLRDQFNMSLDEISKSVGGKSRSAISNTLRLLRLPKQIKQAIVDGSITEGQARPLIDVEEKRALDLLPKIIAEGLNARQIELITRPIKLEKTQRAKNKSAEQYGEQRKQLEDRFGSSVRITTTQRGAGKITISFKDAKDFERISQNLL